MPNQLTIQRTRQLRNLRERQIVPALIVDAGRRATTRFLEFFTAHIPNDNTRRAYLQAARQFAPWCSERGLTLQQITPIVVAGYIKQLRAIKSIPTVKQHLAAIRTLFNHLETGNAVERNPAGPVRAPKYVVTKGKTPVLDGADAQRLVDSIPTHTMAGLRDRAIICVMVYSFARVGQS